MVTYVFPNSNGSGVFSQQVAEHSHLINLPGGLAAEVQDVRRDLGVTLTPEIGLTIDEWDGPNTGSTLVMTMIPKMRMGTVLLHREVMDGTVISPPTGAFHQTGPGNLPAVVTGTTSVANPALYGVGGTLDSTGAVVTGTTDITAAGLYGSGGTLAGGGTGLTLILTVNGVGPTTLTFDGTGATNDASEAAMLAAIHSTWPSLVATAGGPGGNKLVLTDTLHSSSSVVVVGAGTANTALGLAAPTNVSGTNSTLILNVNGAGALTLVLSGAGNTANEAAFLAAIQAEWTSLTATQGSNPPSPLVLTDVLLGYSNTIVVGAGTSNAALGLTPATYYGFSSGNGDWVYVPATPPSSSSAASITGSADVSVSSLYFTPANNLTPATPGTLSGLTLQLTVNGKYNSLTFLDVVNPLNPPIVDGVTVLKAPPTLLQVIEQAFPGVVATLDATSSPAHLVLTDVLSGSTQSITVWNGTANSALGLTGSTAGVTTSGTGHSYSVQYEYDGTLVKNGTAFVAGGPPYVNNFSGP